MRALDTEYLLLVPAKGVVHDVRAGSAIVGDERDGMVDTHYEGGGASNVTTLEHRIHHAAGRRREKYPTIARRSWRRDEVVVVGTVRYDPGMRHWTLGSITDEVALRLWVGPDEPLVVGGSDGLLLEQGGRALATLPHGEQARIMAMRLPPVATCAEAIEWCRTHPRS